MEKLLTFYFLNIVIFSLFNLLLFLIINYYKNQIFSSLVDRPDNFRKFHNKPVLLIGGIFIAIYLAMISFYYYFSDRNDIFIISIIPLAIFFVGLIDDYLSINAYKKLFFVSIILLVSLNFYNEIIIETLYFSTLDKNFELGNLSLFFTTLCILLLINTLNLSDGINGLAVGISIIWLSFLLLKENSDLEIILIPLIFLLILLFTFIYQEKFFLGDNGSLVLSSFIGLITIYTYNQNLTNESTKISSENIFILFMVPGIDMFRLFVERLLKKKNPFDGDRNHLHHFLINKFSLKITLLIYFFTIIFFIILDDFKIVKSAYLIIFYICIYILSIINLKKNYFKRL
jgi:UDP-GlcNAc:undecaprenyl-phosphate GlcNAc-1-phosphate transferase